MNAFELRLTLEEPAAFSQSPGSLGSQETWSHLPGRRLLGALAARLWGQLGARLLDGSIRLGDAWPEVGGRPAYPIPLSVQQAKAARTSESGRSACWDLAFVDRPAGQQLQAPRGAYGAQDQQALILAAPARTLSLRTALQSEGRAREGFLYHLDLLAAGQSFLARVEADDPADLAALKASLEADPQLELGRSRQAELGRVRAEVRPLVGAPPATGPTDRLIVVARSDLALIDPETGAPTFTLTPAHLGLPAGWRLDPAGTFLKTHRVSVFDGTRRTFDPERRLIRAGSVFRFAGPSKVDPRQLSALQVGLGLFRNEGLGRLALATQVERLRVHEPAAPPTKAEAPDDELFRWLKARRDQVRAEDRDAAADHLEATKLAQRIDLPKSQWRMLADLVRRQPKGADLIKVVREKVSQGQRAKRWLRAWEDLSQNKSFQAAAAAGDAQRLARFLDQVARQGGGA